MILLTKEIYELMFKQKHKIFPHDNRMKDVTEISGKEVRISKNVFGKMLAFTQGANLDIEKSWNTCQAVFSVSTRLLAL